MAGGYLPDGTVVDSHFDLSPLKSAFHSQVGEHDVQIGQVITVYPADDKRNISQKFVEYDVAVFENRITIAMYRNCRTIDSFGGNQNFNEVVLHGTTNFSVDQAYKNRAGLRNGAMVLVACLSGHKNQPVIIAAVQHPAWNGDITSSPVPEFDGASSPKRDADMKAFPTLLPGAKESDGNRILGEYNGFRWGVDQKGAFTVMFQGAKKSDGSLASDAGPTIIRINSNGELVMMDKLDQQVVISPTDKKIYIQDGMGNGIIVDSNSKDVTQVAKTVHLGSAQATEPLVLGQTFTNLLQVFLNSSNVALQALATASVGPLAPLKPGFLALSAACQVALAQLPTIVSKKAFTELGP